MHFKSPVGLHYPITVAKLRKQSHELIKRQEALFEYSYNTTVEEVTRYGQVNKVHKALVSTCESTVEGKLLSWNISVGHVIQGPNTPLAEVEEECTHSIQYGGMCVKCGKDLTTLDYTAALPETTRASTTVTPNHPALRISDEEAARSDEEAKSRLLARRKLSLVVDLDLTIIHASVDPTIQEWMDDENNPNHPAVKDVKVFDLYDEALQRNVSYYIKLRPNLYNFLEIVSHLYELHIYTMGTRSYAESIAKLVDPNKKLFGERILSRTETPGEVSKNLRKLFPVDNRMVVIIDDRADVWNWSNYLVRVQPFNFFVGIGDINSSFLPKEPMKDVRDSPSSHPSTQPDTSLAQETETTVESEDSGADPVQSQGSSGSSSSGLDTNGDKPDGDESALGQLVSMQENAGVSDIQRKTAEQDEQLAAQLNERPLLQLQKSLEKQEEEAAGAGVAETVEEQDHGGDTQSTGMERTRSASRAPVPQTLLKDDDTELFRIESILVKIQRTFFNMFDERVEEDEQQTAVSSLIPDVKDVIEQHRTYPLKGCGVVFSRLVPRGVDVMRSRWADMAIRLGAVVQTDLRENTTHVICKPGDPTSKMREAAHRNLKRRATEKSRIHIVAVDWLCDSVGQWWRRVSEEPYEIPVAPAIKKRRSSGLVGENYFSDTLGDSAEGEEETGNKPRVNSDWAPEDEESDEEAEETKNPEEEAAEWEEAFEMQDEDLSDSEDEENEVSSVKDGSVRSVDSAHKINATIRVSNKRRREDDSDRGSESDGSSAAGSQQSVRKAENGEGSRLQIRKRRAFERTTSLTRVANATTIMATETGGAKPGNPDEAEEEDDGLEAAMLEALGEADGADDEGEAS